MVLEEGEGSLEKVAVEIFEREREGISEVVSWLLGLHLFVCREPPQSDSPLLSVDVYPLALVAIVFRRRALAYPPMKSLVLRVVPGWLFHLAFKPH